MTADEIQMIMQFRQQRSMPQYQQQQHHHPHHHQQQQHQQQFPFPPPDPTSFAQAAPLPILRLRTIDGTMIAKVYSAFVTPYMTRFDLSDLENEWPSAHLEFANLKDEFACARSNLFTLVLKFIRQKLVNNASIASGTWDTAHAAFKAGNMGVLKPAWTNNVLFDAAGNPNTILEVLLDSLGSALSPAKGWGDFRNQSDRQSNLTKLRKVVAEPNFTKKVTGFSVLFRETCAQRGYSTGFAWFTAPPPSTATPASGLAIAGAPAAASASSSVPAGAMPFSNSGYAVEMPLGNTSSMLINPGNPASPLHLAAHNGLDPGIFELLARSGNGSGSASLTMSALTSAAVPLATSAPSLVPVETTTAPFPSSPLPRADADANNDDKGDESDATHRSAAAGVGASATPTSGSVVEPQVGAAHGLTSPAAAIDAAAAAQDPAGVVDGETEAKLRQSAASEGGVIEDNERAKDNESAWTDAQVTQETDPTNNVENAPPAPPTTPATWAKSTRVRKPSAKRAATLAAFAISVPRRTKTKAKK
ncbi:hypothetical protein H9P43_006810 [Blastocladiella emersonii ATCC 22665]|nr:hypothetical protein H9P43_006810 [Blastocladiella emersonii ATCC 22665]